jgi:hypothetical protein
MRRGWLALLGVAFLIALAGCGSLLGPGEPDQEALQENKTYDWDTQANTSITLARSNFTAVLTVSNKSEVRLYRVDGVGTDRPLQISALKFRYPNGTVLNASGIEVEKKTKRTVVTLPQEEGQVAFTSPRSGKRFATPVFVDGSFAMHLPPGARVGVPLLSQVSPSASERSVDDSSDRMTLLWSSTERDSVLVRYYLERDLLIFGSLFAVLSGVAIGGALYYLRKIRRLERQREEIGLNVDTEDDEFDDGPPPGMQ